MSVQIAIKTITPKAFIWRRLHSLFGLWIVLFLIEHLLTNSQAALLVGADGEGFIRSVNFIKNLPYLPAIEIFLLGVPILFHALWGIKYLFTAKMNSFPSSGKTPSLPKYARNYAYSLQRISSWILLIGLIGHIAFMRFYMYPASIHLGDHSFYFVRLSMDPGLYTVSDRLGVTLFDQQRIDQMKREIEKGEKERSKWQEEIIQQKQGGALFSSQENILLQEIQKQDEKREILRGLQAKAITSDEVIAKANDFGTATLLAIRDSFKSIFKSVLYTIFVLAAVYHAFNGLWTFMITWGVVIKMGTQKRAVAFCMGLLFLIGCLGLAAIWGTYWINLLG
ncbi:MAG: succinate dehydrogenase [Simkania negevensis]|nr:succinate dehydrogenase [Simkania negevensis]